MEKSIVNETKKKPCRYKIHRGEYDVKAISKYAGEPRDIERVMRGSERVGWESG